MSADALAVPYVCRLVAPWLREQLGGTRVATRVPNPKPSRLVVVQAVGSSGTGSRYLSGRPITGWCYDPDESSCAELAELVCALLLVAPYDPALPALRNMALVGAPVSFPDPDDPSPRFQFSLVATLRAAPVPTVSQEVHP